MSDCADGPGGWIPATEDEAALDQPVDPSILDAIEQGRGQRGRTNPQTWSHHRARVLTEVQRGLSRIRVARELGLSPVQVRTLAAEACDAVLRGGGASEVADEVCAERWQSWCETGDAEACVRLRRD